MGDMRAEIAANRREAGRLQLNQGERLAHARALLSTVEGSGGGPGRRARLDVGPDRAVRDELRSGSADPFRELVPSSLRGTGVVAIVGSSSVAIAALREVAGNAEAAERWILILGAPDFGVEAAIEQGVAAHRLIVIPHPEGRSDVAVAAALDGIDIVVCGEQLRLTDSQQRRLNARVRKQSRFLMSLQPWAGADLTLRITRRQWSGIGQGLGWLQGATAVVEREGRGGYASPVTGTLNLRDRWAG